MASFRIEGDQNTRTNVRGLNHDRHQELPGLRTQLLFPQQGQGEVICRNCSYVIDDTLIDFGEDSRAFDFEEMANKSRTGAPLTPVWPIT